MIKRLFIWTAMPLVFVAFGITHAAGQPLSQKAQALERKAEESQARAAALAARSAQIERDIAAQREAITQAAEDIRAAEQSLLQLEDERASLAAKLATQSVVAQTERARIAGLTSGLLRAVRTPSAAFLISRDAPIDAARGAMLLDAALAAAQARIALARGAIAELDQLKRTLDQKRQETDRAALDLKTRQAAMGQLVEQRQAIYRQTEADRQAETQMAKKISAEATDLRDLVARVDAEREAEAKRKAALRAAPPPKREIATATHGLPVVGKIRIRFGHSDDSGGKAKGLTLVTRSGATVVAPAAGIVRFAGPFRGYREILILEHPGAYHTLIAGMARIDVIVGASIGAGEPVGTMDERPDARPELYFELRRDGQFLDPEAGIPSVDVKGSLR